MTSRRRRASMRVSVATAIIVLAASVFGACSDGHPSTAKRSGPTTSSPTAFTAVALGDEATLPRSPNAPASTTWPQEFYVDALPRASRFVNLAGGRFTTADVAPRFTDIAASLHPRVVAVLLGVSDVAQRVQPAQFGHALRAVLDALQRAGVERVLVATLPPAAGATAGFNDEIRSAVGATHDVLVDLERAGVTGGFDPDGDGFFFDAKGHLAIAKAFTAAYRAAYPNG